MSEKPNDKAEHQLVERPADPAADASKRPRALPNPPAGAGEGRAGALPREIGGPKGPEPTRYGDWEVGGRCTDF